MTAFSEWEPRYLTHPMKKLQMIIDIGLNVARSVTRESECIKTALKLLEKGEVIAVPTDTVYGIACDAQSSNALFRMYSMKGRDKKKPVAVCVGKVEDIGLWADTSCVTADLLNDLLPGPVTILLKRRETLHRCLNPKQENVGIRVPDHPFIQILANELGRPLALTSANLSSEPSAVSVEELCPLWANLGGVFDAGCLGHDRSGSTVVDLTEPGHFTVIRAGQAVHETKQKLFKHGLSGVKCVKSDVL